MISKEQKHSARSSSEDDDKKSRSESVVDRARQGVGNVAGEAKQQATREMEVRKGKTAEQLGEVAEAIRETSDKLKDMGPLGEMVGRAADRIEHLGSYFRGKRTTDIVRDVERFARREPAIFLGTALSIGLIGGRFLKSSPANANAGTRAGGDRERDLESFGSASTMPMPRRTPRENIDQGEPIEVREHNENVIQPTPIVNAVGRTVTAPMSATPTASQQRAGGEVASEVSPSPSSRQGQNPGRP